MENKGERQFVEYLKSEVPFYMKSEFKNVESIHQFPTVTRRIISNDYPLFLSNKTGEDKSELLKILSDQTLSKQGDNELLQYKNYIFEETSGTSGTPFRCIKTVNERLKLGMEVWARRKKVDNLVSLKNYFQFNHINRGRFNPNAYDYSVNHLTDLYKMINDGNFRWLHATPGVLLKHVEILKENGCELTLPNLKYLECTGHYYTEEQKMQLETFYGSKLINVYGSIETWPIAIMCNNGKMHINDKAIYFELLDESDHVITEPEKIGRVVVTTLISKTLPLVRYVTGDFACYEAEECQCGMTSRTIRLVKGREANLIFGMKEKVFGNIIFKEVMGLINFLFPDNGISYVQIIQVEFEKFLVYMNEICETKAIQSKFCELVEEKLHKKIAIDFITLSEQEIYSKRFEKPNIFLSKCTK